MIPKPLKWLIVVLAVIGCGLTVYLMYMAHPEGGAPSSEAVSGAESRFGAAGQGKSSPFATGRRASGAVEAIAEIDPPYTNISEHQIGGMIEPSAVTAEQLQAFVNKHGRDADSLVAAFKASGDASFLREAATNFVNNPKVLFEAVSADAFPDDRRTWIDRLKASAPDNALAYYLSARDYVQKNELGQAMDELLAGSQKNRFIDYAKDSMQGLEEAYLSAGMLPAKAKAAALAGSVEKTMDAFRDVASEMERWQQEYKTSGDKQSALVVAQMGVRLGSHLSQGEGGSFLLQQLVGTAIETKFLNQLDPTAQYDFLGQTPASRLEQIQKQRQSNKTTVSQWQRAMDSASEADILQYYDRVKTSGEAEAMSWFLATKK